MKKNSSVFWFIVVAIMLAIVLLYVWQSNSRYKWYETLNIEGDEPYDLKVFFSLLEENARGDETQKLERSLKVELENLDTTKSYTYVSISKSFFPDTAEIRALENFLRRGNSMVVSTNRLSTIMPLALQFGTDSLVQFYHHVYNEDMYAMVPDSVLSKYKLAENYNEKDSIFNQYKKQLGANVFDVKYIDSAFSGLETTIKMSQTKQEMKLAFRKGADTINSYWNGVFFPENFQVKEVAAFKNGAPAIVDLPVGKGHLYINSTPLIFTNVFLKEKNNFLFINQFLAEMPQGTYLLEDVNRYNHRDSFSPKAQISESPLTFILSQPALKWAWYTLLGGVLLFVLFKSKRKQRIIPILKPNINTTLAYAKMLGSLQLKDKNNIAKGKEISSHFLQHLRSKNRWHGSRPNDDLKTMLIKLVPDLNREIQIVMHLISKSVDNKPLTDMEIINLFNYTKLIAERI